MSHDPVIDSYRDSASPGIERRSFDEPRIAARPMTPANCPGSPAALWISFSEVRPPRQVVAAARHGSDRGQRGPVA